MSQSEYVSGLILYGVATPLGLKLSALSVSSVRFLKILDPKSVVLGNNEPVSLEDRSEPRMPRISVLPSPTSDSL